MKRRTIAVAGGLALAGAFALGWIVRNSSDPFVLDHPFWRQFWSGPPAAGVFAFAGAVVAFLAAAIAAWITRVSARRKEWWDRAEWALSNVVSDVPGQRDVGLAAVEVVITDATPQEAALLDAVTARFLPSEPQPPGGVDTGATGSAQ